MRQKYVIITDSRDEFAETKAVAAAFEQLQFVGNAYTYDEGLDLILETAPDLVFLEIEPSNPKSALSLHLVNEVARYLPQMPKFIVTAKSMNLAVKALQHEVHDFLVTPFRALDLRKAVMRLPSKPNVPPAGPSMQEFIVTHPLLPSTDNPEVVSDETGTEEIIQQRNPEQPLMLCVKSYGDYRFIPADQICYLQADNNSTDIHLQNGEMITAFKTLKHFESILDLPFVRIHNSYIVNSNFVTRIHLGTSVCYVKHNIQKIPFSKSYKESVERILAQFAGGNYLEI